MFHQFRELVLEKSLIRKLALGMRVSLLLNSKATQREVCLVEGKGQDTELS